MWWVWHPLSRCSAGYLLRFVKHRLQGMAWPEALWSGLFHAVSSFNNAGFALYADGLMGFASDAWILVPIMFAIVLGGIGFPVLQDMRQRWRDPHHWSLHTKLTLVGTGLLLGLGFFGVLLFEWSNPGTLGPMSVGDKVLNSAFASVSARTAGFNSLDVGAMRTETLAVHYLLMFVGGGSAGLAASSALSHLNAHLPGISHGIALR